MKKYLTIEILVGCERFKVGQVCQVPVILALKKIARGEAKVFEPEIKPTKSVQKDEIILKKEVINKKNIE